MAEMALFGLQKMCRPPGPSTSNLRRHEDRDVKTGSRKRTLIARLYHSFTGEEVKDGNELEQICDSLYNSQENEDKPVISEKKMIDTLKMSLIHQGKHKESRRFFEDYNKLTECTSLKNREGIIRLLYMMYERKPIRGKNTLPGKSSSSSSTSKNCDPAVPPSHSEANEKNNQVDQNGDHHFHSIMQSHYRSKPNTTAENQNGALKSILKEETTKEPSSMLASASSGTSMRSNHTLASICRPRLDVNSQASIMTQQSYSKIAISNRQMEAELIRNLVFVFQGIDGDLIKFNSSKACYDIITKSPIPQSMRMQTLRLCGLGSLHNKIKFFCDKPSTGLVVQSLKYALQKELREYYRLLAAIQSEVHSSTTLVDTPMYEELVARNDMSLLKLTNYVFDCIPRMKLLADVIERCQNKRGGEICSVLHYFSEFGDPVVSSVATTLLSITAKPIYLMLCQWILYGELEDHFNEFFIGADLECPKENLWHTKYHISKKMLPSFISINQAAKILATGKNINFLKEICQYSKGYSGRNEIKSILEKSPVECLFMEEESVLKNAIEKGYETTSKMVLKVLIEDSKLLDHLKAIKNFLLLGKGDFIQYLLELMQNELSKPASKIFNHNLVGILESAVRATTCQFEDEDILNRLDTRILASSNKDVGWDVFCLDYKVDGPISSVLTYDAITRYHQVFNLLWRIKRTEMILSNLWKNQATLFRYQRIIPELGSVLHRSQLLISEMIHFVHQTQYYIMFEATESAWDKLMEEVSKSTDLDNVISAHTQFLNTIKSRSLLVPESRELLNQLRGIFDSIHELRNFLIDLDDRVAVELMFRKGLKPNSAEQREAQKQFFASYIMQAKGKIETLYTTTQDLVRSFLLVLNRQHDLSLQCLSFRLDFSEYYHRKEPSLSLPFTFQQRRLSANNFAAMSTSGISLNESVSSISILSEHV